MEHNQPRRPLVAIGTLGISVVHPLSPIIAAWWSAAFPGFGHYLVNQYLLGTLLTLAEVIINNLAHLNEAIVYSFCGRFDLAKAVVQPQWALGYGIIYFYTIWDSYRSALTQNKLYQLALLDNERIQATFFNTLTFQYIEKTPPFTPAVYSFLFPGLGQLYNHQTGLALWAMLWWWIHLIMSHCYESLFYLLLGNIETSVSILNPQWLLFMPSIWGGSIYYAYLTALEHNRLFRREQRQYFGERYRDSAVRIFA
ncbi:MAG: hypothetical protein P4N59_11765 [Negativicutes bacterium]|nr:hypothetical protein [Negativicutes bacterium]